MGFGCFTSIWRHGLVVQLQGRAFGNGAGVQQVAEAQPAQDFVRAGAAVRGQGKVQLDGRRAETIEPSPGVWAPGVAPAPRLTDWW